MKKKILLTGGTGSLGKALIKVSGHHIVAPKRTDLDLSDYAQVSAFDTTGYDVIILNASGGIGKFSAFDTLPDEIINENIDVNIKSTVKLISKFIRQNSTGSIILIGSRTSFFPRPENLLYSASKNYMNFIFDVLSAEYRNHTWHMINPGRFKAKHLSESVNTLAQDEEELARHVLYVLDTNIRHMNIWDEKSYK